VPIAFLLLAFSGSLKLPSPFGNIATCLNEWSSNFLFYPERFFVTRVKFASNSSRNFNVSPTGFSPCLSKFNTMLVNFIMQATR